MNDNSKNKIKEDIICLIILVIVSIILIVFTIMRVKYFNYKEATGTLISHDEIKHNYDSEDTCHGTFEYYVNENKYTATFIIDSVYCYEGSQQIIYYDTNNPEKNTNNKLISLFVFLVIADCCIFIGIFFKIKSIIKKQRKIKIEENRIYKKKTYSHNIYGTYEMIYDSEDSFNKYSMKDESYIEIKFKDLKKIENLISEFGLNIPKSKLNKFIEFDSINSLLDNYRSKEKMYLENAVQLLVDQEISTMTIWYGIPNTEEAKRLAKKVEFLSIGGFTVDENMDLVSIFMYYNYNSDASFQFEYNVKTKKISDVDVHS